MGSIEFLVNCAGLVIADKLHDIKEQDWDKVMDVDLKGSFLVGQAVTKEMAKKRYGKVVFISSVSAQDAEYGIASYCVAKAGVNMLTHCFALEMAEYGINVNSVNPASINTQLMQDAFRTRAAVENMTEEEYRKKYCSAFPLGRIGEPREVAQLCAVLCSDELAFMDGENVLLTGGKVMRM